VAQAAEKAVCALRSVNKNKFAKLRTSVESLVETGKAKAVLNRKEFCKQLVPYEQQVSVQTENVRGGQRFLPAAQRGD
jgi:ribosomal protein L17